MDTLLAAGLGLTALGVGGYLVGVWQPYPGRAFAITGVMVGLTLWAIGNAERNGDDGQGGEN